jgi:N6-L-threonylcarbamoyladenine synthase
MLVLGIETTCDETAAAVVERLPQGPGKIRSNVVLSQIDEHAPFGGVVPEIAARAHVEALDFIIEQAMGQAGVRFAELHGIAAAAGPGLIGGVIVGLTTAKAIALVAEKPLIAVNHLEAHALTARLTNATPFPYCLFLASGGHTQIVAVLGVGQYVRLGTTVDDAIGEAFDKVAKLLGLPYPGGAQVDRLARGGDARAIDFPRGLSKRPREQFDFSFSGLKTAVLHHLRARGAIPDGQELADLCASFQEAVCDALTLRAVRAARAAGVSRLVVCGGVAANSRLRSLARERCEAEGVSVYLPAPRLCTDNGAMIALAGAVRLARGERASLDAAADPGWRL